jgi:hypothetical protein
MDSAEHGHGHGDEESIRVPCVIHPPILRQITQSAFHPHSESENEGWTAAASGKIVGAVKQKEN